MEASIFEQLRLLQSLIETDQKTVDAVGARLSLIAEILKNIMEQVEQREEANRKKP